MILRDILRVSYGSRSASKICTTGFRTFSCFSWTCTSHSISLQVGAQSENEDECFRRLRGVDLLTIPGMASHVVSCKALAGGLLLASGIGVRQGLLLQIAMPFFVSPALYPIIIGDFTDTTSHFRIEDTERTVFVNRITTHPDLGSHLSGAHYPILSTLFNPRHT